MQVRTETLRLANDQIKYTVHDHMTADCRRSLKKIDLSFDSIQLRKGRIRQSASGCYTMDRFPHGIALIINNKTFESEEETTDGAEIDEHNLVIVFQYLGYRVHVFDNCTSIISLNIC